MTKCEPGLTAYDIAHKLCYPNTGNIKRNWVQPRRFRLVTLVVRLSDNGFRSFER